MQIQPLAMTSKCCGATANTVGNGEGTYYALCSSCGKACDVNLADTSNKANPTPTQDGQTRELLRLASLVGTDAKNPEANLLACIAALCTERERLARIDELSHVQLEHGHHLTQTFSSGQSMTIEERIAELRQQSSSQEVAE